MKTKTCSSSILQSRCLAEGARITAVDLFCGVGGLTHGLVRGGINVVAGIDIDRACCYPYETNNKAHFLERDLKQLSATEIASLFKTDGIRLLAGCAPCQPFSTYSQAGRATRDDGKWALLTDFGRLIEELQPELVTMENVPQLPDHPVFEQFLRSLDGYHIWHKVVRCAEYGVPQSRKRLVLVASKLGPIELIAPTHTEKPPTLREAISGLPSIKAGQTHVKDRLHAACRLSATNLKRIRASRPGGTWRDWPADLLAECHGRESGKTYSSVYGRMEWDAPAPTITTQCFGFGNGRFGHPEQDRAISLREAAIIQTFPKDYRFVPDDAPVQFAPLGRLIGNAVPVRIGEVVAETFIQHLTQVGRAA
jgi:DNA (cytosine-5)-methyltransferase 1